MKTLRKIGLLAFDRRKEIKERMSGIVSDPAFRNIEFYGCKSLPAPVKSGIKLLSDKKFLENIEAAVSFGGDGTFISAARFIRDYGIPLVGINMGTLGFLTEIPVVDSRDYLAEIFSGQYVVEKRMTFQITLLRNGRTIHIDQCLNDAVIKGPRLIKLSMEQNGKPVASYNADGLIISTPTGSTAYSLAAGGPIVDPTLDCVIITPLCPHSLTQKPVVTGIRKSITVGVDSPDVKGDLTIDGKVCVPIHVGDKITISRSKTTTDLIKPVKSSYFDILRRKLNWG